MTPPRNTEAPARMTVSRMAEQQHALLEAFAARPSRGGDNTVSITRNAKGQFQFSVEVVHTDANEAYRKACELAQALAQKFPYDEERVAKLAEAYNKRADDLEQAWADLAQARRERDEAREALEYWSAAEEECP